MRSPEKKDYLEYTVEIPKAGPWKLWAYVRHEDTNSNSFYLSAPAAVEPVRFLNDYDFGAWHWVAGDMLKLPAGQFTFRLYSREARQNLSPALDMLVWVNDRSYVPALSDVKKAAAKAPKR